MKKSKVLIFGLTSFVGGVETFIINIAKNIDQEKFEINFLVQDDVTGINKEKIEGYYNKIHKVENLKRHPVKSFKTLNKIYKKEKFDVVHLNISTSSSSLYALPIKLCSKKTKIIVHSHNGSDKNKIQHLLFREIQNIITDKFLACSRLAANWMFGKRIGNSNKTTIINNAIVTEDFLYNNIVRNKIRKEIGIKEGDFVIGHVGRFNPQKNHLGMIEILRDVLSSNEDIKLALLGTGELEKEIKNKVKDYNIEKNVIFVGVKSNVNEYYQAMDLFVLPSIFEGLPIVGIEAQASGLKCIFSDNVTRETDITGNVEFISLKQKDKWEESVMKIKQQNYKRENVRELIEKSGYDLKSQIKLIEQIYTKEEV